jgi:outer membrane protein TolC
MMHLKNRYLAMLFALWSVWCCGQVDQPLSRKQGQQNLPAQGQVMDTMFMSFKEFLGYVKQHHPVAKQGDLLLDEGQVTLVRARGGFDPKIEADYARKEFKGTEYYDELNAVFKIPTYYGVEFKAAVERNEGAFLNTRDNVPLEGLYSAGLSVNLAQGLLINERMATLQQAKLFKQQSLAERDLVVNQILFDASVAYFQWWRAAREARIYDTFNQNAQFRLRAVVRSYQAGALAVIDTVEASIAADSRALSYEQALLDLRNNRLELSNFIWLNDIPVELRESTFPETELIGQVDATLEIMGMSLDGFTVQNHPKLVSMNFKIDQLEVERRLKANMLLPRLTIDYNFITPEWNALNSVDNANYKAGVSFSVPLFLRKERGDLQLAKFKLQNARYDFISQELRIQTKVSAVFNDLASFERQQRFIDGIVTSSELMLIAEERKFELGDSSLFLVNTREAKLIESNLKQLEITLKWLNAKAKLFNSLAVMPENL